MQAVKIGKSISLYNDTALPEQYKSTAMYVTSIPEKPIDCECHLDIVNRELVWVLEPEIEPTAQDDVDAMIIDHEYRLTLIELGVTE